jgi:bifunctional non-homologous end joining protein LigD
MTPTNDDAAVPGWDPEAHPESVKTGRTNDDLRRPETTADPAGAV